MIAVLENLEKKFGFFNKSQNLNVPDLLASNLTVEELIDFAIKYNGDNKLGIESKQELIKRGKDNIQERILIRKTLKTSISHLEDLIKILEGEKKQNKKQIASYHQRFLTAVSLQDKLQLEWLKHDLQVK